jgi:hypothetical protein
VAALESNDMITNIASAKQFMDALFSDEAAKRSDHEIWMQLERDPKAQRLAFFALFHLCMKIREKLAEQKAEIERLKAGQALVLESAELDEDHPLH